MKKKLSFLWLLAVPALSTVAIASSCNEQKEQKETKGFTKTAVNATSPRVALTDPENPRWVKAQTEFLNNFDSLSQGAAATLAKTQQEQNTWIDTAISGGTSGLIIGSINGESLAKQLRDAKNKKIPVIAYDRLISGTTDYDWYLTYDNWKVGTLQGLTLATSLLGKTGERFKTKEEALDYLKANPIKEDKIIILMGGASSDNNSQLFYGGAMEVLKPLIDETKEKEHKIMIKGRETKEQVLQNDWSYDEGRTRVQTTLTALSESEKSQVRGVLAPNDGMAQAAVTALKTTNIDTTKVFITGQDFNDFIVPLIKEDSVNMTIFKPDKELSYASIVLLNILIEENKNNANSSAEDIFKKVETKFKEKFPEKGMILDKQQYEKSTGVKVNTILLEPTIVTKDNIDTFK
ncbi:substrate-binding domain-containing protein [Mesomycoplasma neurolyticum]|uniref:46 kDa surface antigen n=1 Tax=Mesomycoplasma neurolyticum TaxID=2120 RepID=A0A449A6G5_9BACT|nr:substrate-binding domain-containing protein [Mesomycoplasma neurolyticum]VEU59834.1 46 kDa surface antigen [Mesomycoplasma neurolyticum]